MGRRYNSCPNCGKRFTFHIEKRYCDVACCEAFWMKEISEMGQFLAEKGLHKEFFEWRRLQMAKEIEI